MDTGLVVAKKDGFVQVVLFILQDIGQCVMVFVILARFDFDGKKHALPSFNDKVGLTLFPAVEVVEPVKTL